MIVVRNYRQFGDKGEYIGRQMKEIKGSVLGNPFKLKPYGPYDRGTTIKLYKKWLWNQMNNKESAVYSELQRLKDIADQGDLDLVCWCAPEACHGDIIKAAIEWLGSKD
jgi:hypothetical protein